MSVLATGLALLAVIVAGSAVLIWSAHIPVVRVFTGAAPLQSEPQDTAIRIPQQRKETP